MTRLASLILVLLSSGLAMGQPPVSEPPLLTLEDLARSVVFLTGPEADARPPVGKELTRPAVVHIGTGFLVVIEDTVYLVTAEHVSTKLRENAGVTIASTGDAPITFPLASLCGGRAPAWITHGTADVAVLALSPSPEVLAQLLPRALTPSLFTKDSFAPPRNRPLTTVGFPLGLGVLITGPGGKLSPISREAKPVSGLLTIARFDTKVPSTFFLLDSPSIGGFSGSPVFIIPGAYSEGSGLAFSATVLCVGLIHGTLKDNNEGRLTAVVPSSDIVLTLERAHHAHQSARFRPFP